MPPCGCDCPGMLSGSGAPTSSAAAGSIYYDTLNGIWYVNLTGTAGGWYVDVSKDPTMQWAATTVRAGTGAGSPGLQGVNMTNGSSAISVAGSAFGNPFDIPDVAAKDGTSGGAYTNTGTAGQTTKFIPGTQVTNWFLEPSEGNLSDWDATYTFWVGGKATTGGSAATLNGRHWAMILFGAADVGALTDNDNLATAVGVGVLQNVTSQWGCAFRFTVGTDTNWTLVSNQYDGATHNQSTVATVGSALALRQRIVARIRYNRALNKLLGNINGGPTVSLTTNVGPFAQGNVQMGFCLAQTGIAGAATLGTIGMSKFYIATGRAAAVNAP